MKTNLKPGSDKVITLDCDCEPTQYENMVVVEHRTYGHQLRLRTENIVLEGHQGLATGYEVKKRYQRRKVLNEPFLRYLLDHQELIPENLRGNYLVALGTVYRDHAGMLRVPNLHFGPNNKWVFGLTWLGQEFGHRTKFLLIKEEENSPKPEKKKDSNGSGLVFKVVVIMIIILAILIAKNWAILASF